MNESRGAWLESVFLGAGIYLATSLPVYVGVVIATSTGLIEQKGRVTDSLHGFCHFDGGHFESIIENGYRYERDRGSTIAFFPGYPLLAGVIQRVTGWPTRLAMVVATNAALCIALIFLARYLRARFPDQPRLQLVTLLVIGLWPAGLFFRMAYSESLFLLFLALLLLGSAQRWPVGVLAAIAGTLTGIRAVGVAASAAVIVSVLADPSRGAPSRRILSASLLAPLTCWGLLGFMGYQLHHFGTPFAFVDVQRHWAFHTPGPADIPTKAARLVLAEPIWNTYVPGSSRYWARDEALEEALLGLEFWNPLLFLVAILAVTVGWSRAWLTRNEVILGLGLLLIPYLTRADEMSMGSHARFAAIVVPAHLVLARLIERLPLLLAGILFVILGAVLALWSALFAAHWPLC